MMRGAYMAFYICVRNQRRGLVEPPRDWPWSSWRFHAFGISPALAMASIAVNTARQSRNQTVARPSWP
jgi:hypothetical protein